MNTSAQNFIESFDKLPKAEQHKVASEILRRMINFNLPLSDDELVLSADELFLELDRREAEDARP